MKSGDLIISDMGSVAYVIETKPNEIVIRPIVSATGSLTNYTQTLPPAYWSHWKVLQSLTQLLYKAKKEGGHFHISVYSRTLPSETWENCGKIVFNEIEWPDVRKLLCPERQRPWTSFVEQ